MTPHPLLPARWFPPDEFYVADLCTRCGVCCGSTDGHPCEHLRHDTDGRFSCESYETRLGFHRRLDGSAFVCVPIRKVIEMTGGYAGCGYVEEIRRTRKGLGQKSSDLGRRTKP
jgi:hypothetical protein